MAVSAAQPDGVSDGSSEGLSPQRDSVPMQRRPQAVPRRRGQSVAKQHKSHRQAAVCLEGEASSSEEGELAKDSLEEVEVSGSAAGGASHPVQPGKSFSDIAVSSVPTVSLGGSDQGSTVHVGVPGTERRDGNLWDCLQDLLRRLDNGVLGNSAPVMPWAPLRLGSCLLVSVLSLRENRWWLLWAHSQIMKPQE